jgi:hypothetical protein
MVSELSHSTHELQCAHVDVRRREGSTSEVYALTCICIYHSVCNRSTTLNPACVASSNISMYLPVGPCSNSISTVPRPSKSLSVAPGEQPASNNGSFCWIVSDNLEGFKTKENMHAVRQTAMASYLKTEKSQENSKSKSSSEVSDKSRASIRSDGTTKPRPIAVPRKKSNSVRKHRSPTKSSPPRYPDATTPSSEAQMARARRSFQGVLPQAPIVVPIMKGKEYPFDAFRMPHLVPIGESLDPFRTMYQSVCPHVSVTQLKHHCSQCFGTEGLGVHWIPACLNHAHTFLSTLYMASAHHDVVQRRKVESLETTALRQDIIHFVGGNLTNPTQRVADHQIIAVSQLILGEVIGRNEASLRYHQAGMETMIKHRGGLKELGMGGHLASVVSWAHLATSVILEVRPSLMYVEYCASRSTKIYSPSTTIPESPIYYPHGKYLTLERSEGCKLDALRLLNDVRVMIEAFLQETKQRRRNSDKLITLYTRITQHPSIQNLGREHVLRESDWRYEAIRIAAVVQACAIIHRIPLSDALQHVQIVVKPPSVYTSSIASQSNDSLVSPFDARNDTPVTEYSESPSFSTRDTLQEAGFPFTSHRESDASAHSFSSAQRPSVASFHSTSSEILPWVQYPAPTAVTDWSTLTDLKDVLEKSNLSECWSDMAGVLLWIGLVMGAASSRKDNDEMLRRYFSSTTIKACIMLCFEHPEAMHATMLKMTDIVEALSRDGNAQITRKGNDGPRKRAKAST